MTIEAEVGYTDVGDIRVLGGMPARFRHDAAEHYGVPVGTYAGRSRKSQRRWSATSSLSPGLIA